MHIAILGTRGIPACYSGFETFAEQLSLRLVARGHEVTVYNRVPFNRYREPTYRGVRLVHLPTIRTKWTDTIVHTSLSVLHCLRERTEIAYFCGVGNALLAGMPRLRGMRTVVNVDGADYARAKWSGFGRWWLKQSEQWACALADVIVADNGVIQRRYWAEYRQPTVLIPYGACVVHQDPGTDHLVKFGLNPDGYFLYVSRLTPENAADLTMKAHLQSGSELPLVVVGDAPYQGAYIEKLRRTAQSSSGRIIMTGYQFGLAYQQLSFHARAFILPTAIEATRPVLLDQMGFGNAVIARDTPGNLEVLGGTGLTFSHLDPVPSLARAIQRLSRNAIEAKRLGQAARRRIAEVYDWEKITDRYEALFYRLLGRSTPRS